MMTIKQRKSMLIFLKHYQEYLEKNEIQELSKEFQGFFTRAELIEILEHNYFNEYLDEQNITTLENTDLLELIGDDYSLVSYSIEKIEQSITASPTLSQKEKKNFFEKRHLESHYLNSKPIEQWDGYDRATYYSLLWKHGKTKRVFAIFSADVEEADKYVVSTQPSFFFDTREEAEKECENIIRGRKFKEGDLKIMSLWQLV